jgi:hypothetical protein
MSRRDYRLLAAVIGRAFGHVDTRTIYGSDDYRRGHCDGSAYAFEVVVAHLEQALAENNPRFNRNRFETAVGDAYGSMAS